MQLRADLEMLDQFGHSPRFNELVPEPVSLSLLRGAAFGGVVVQSAWALLFVMTNILPPDVVNPIAPLASLWLLPGLLTFLMPAGAAVGMVIALLVRLLQAVLAAMSTNGTARD
ncbi:MAG: hypothetical protein SGJ20_02100 [Planctomycetota bacterium]|nr:hypothetical protein [Planctomycetota bacterium]